MWFGDLVTMRWFNDVWMKEVFANFMAAKIVNPSFPGINHELRFLLRPLSRRLRRGSHGWHQRHPPAARQPRRGRHALRRDHLQKAPIVMRQLEVILGRGPLPRRPARVSDGAPVRQCDLARPDPRARRGARRRTSRPGATPGWRRRAGRTITTEPAASRTARIARLAFDQRDPVAAARADVDRAACSVHARLRRLGAGPAVRLDGPRTWTSPTRAACRRRASCCPTGGGIGYGGFAISTPARRAYLLAHLPDIADPLTRGAAVGDVVGRHARRPVAARRPCSTCCWRRSPASATS